MGLEALPSRHQWLLLALDAAQDRGLTPVQIQKALFVLSQRRKDDVGGDFYAFRPYHYGPFDAQVYHDADMLVEDGLLTLDLSNGRSMRTYHISPLGEQAAEQIRREVSPYAVEYLQNVVEWTQRLSFSELVRSVYEAFPEMRENSVFRN
jgi:hypothetical protein